jgi:hypothetical protein
VAIPMGGNERSVKPSAQPTLVRTQHLPPPAKTTPDLLVSGRGLIVSWCGRVRLDAAENREMRMAVPNTCPSPADSLDHLIVVPGPGGFLDATFGFVLLAVDAPGVDPQQNIDAVASPLSDLRCGHSGVQPG